MSESQTHTRRKRFGFTDSPNLPKGAVTAPGRVRTYLDNPERKTLPWSCALWDWRPDDIPGMLATIGRCLQVGAGVKVVMNAFEERPKAEANWGFYVSSAHPDRRYFPTSKQDRFIDLQDGYPGDNTIVLQVRDTMEEGEVESGDLVVSASIVDSWQVFWEALISGQPIVIDLTALRPAGTTNKVGLVATGPFGYGDADGGRDTSFLDIYCAIAAFYEEGTIKEALQLLGTINGCIRRGGTYPNGIVTTSMNYQHPAFTDYLNADLVDLPGSHKKSAIVDRGLLDNPDLLKLLSQKVSQESVFLEKEDEDGRNFNVCVGIRVPNGGTCLLNRVNLGIFDASTLHLIPQAMQLAVKQIVNLHIGWREESPWGSGLVAPLERDNQVAVCFMGMANLLVTLKATYADLLSALEDPASTYLDSVGRRNCVLLLGYIQQGLKEGNEVADDICSAQGLPLLDYIWTVEPAQNHSFQTTDVRGKTTCRGIWPPFSQVERRVSETQGTRLYDHGPVETVADVGPVNYTILSEAFFKLLATSGRHHGISFDLMEPADENWIRRFLAESPLTSKYYTYTKKWPQGHLRKIIRGVIPSKQMVCSLENPDSCSVCAE